MARPREFDVEQALDKAMELFWLQGYEATSLQDLLEHMGIARQSLYAAFGDKHQLFLAALDRYYAIATDPILDKLMSADASLADIQDYFATIVALQTAPSPRRSCFLCNAVMELAPHDQAVAQRAQCYAQHLEAAFLNAITCTIARGEVRADHDAQGMACLLTTMVFGLATYAKYGASIDRLHAAVATALLMLTASSCSQHENT